MLLDVLYENTLEIEYNTVTNYMESLDDCMIYIESANDTDTLMDIMESAESVIGKIFNTIIGIFETIKEKSVSFFNRNKEKENKINEELKKNPNAGKEKISVADQKKLDKEYEKAKKRISNGENPEKVLADYKKKARMIIGGLGAITLAAGTAFFLYKKSSDKQMNSLNSEVKNVKSTYEEIVKNKDEELITKNTMLYHGANAYKDLQNKYNQKTGDTKQMKAQALLSKEYFDDSTKINNEILNETNRALIGSTDRVAISMKNN